MWYVMLLKAFSSADFNDRCKSGCGDDSQYIEGARRVLDYMNRLWQEQKLCDVTIQAQCDRLKAHKIALAAYSEFLTEKFCEFPTGMLADMIYDHSGVATGIGGTRPPTRLRKSGFEMAEIR